MLSNWISFSEYVLFRDEPVILILKARFTQCIEIRQRFVKRQTNASSYRETESAWDIVSLSHLSRKNSPFASGINL